MFKREFCTSEISLAPYSRESKHFSRQMLFKKEPRKKISSPFIFVKIYLDFLLIHVKINVISMKKFLTSMDIRGCTQKYSCDEISILVKNSFSLNHMNFNRKSIFFQSDISLYLEQKNAWIHCWKVLNCLC